MKASPHSPSLLHLPTVPPSLLFCYPVRYTTLFHLLSRRLQAFLSA